MAASLRIFEKNGPARILPSDGRCSKNLNCSMFNNFEGSDVDG